MSQSRPSARSVGPVLLLLLLAAGILIVVVVQSGSRVSVGPQQTVQSINPKMGVHTRLTDEVEEWKVKRTLEMVREMRANWIVEFFPWAYVEPNRPGEGKWDDSDMVIRRAAAQGLKVIARLGYVPQWARPDDTTPLYLDEEHYELRLACNLRHEVAAFEHAPAGDIWRGE